MTSTIKADEQVVLRADGLGRVRTPVERRQQILEEFGRSGLSGAKFAALAGIKYSTFASWMSKRRRQIGAVGGVPAKPVDSMRWLEAVVEQAQDPGAPSAKSLILELPGGARAQIGEVHQAVLAAALVHALEKPC